jgi:hypothetical protein
VILNHGSHTVVMVWNYFRIQTGRRVSGGLSRRERLSYKCASYQNLLLNFTLLRPKPHAWAVCSRDLATACRGPLFSASRFDRESLVCPCKNPTLGCLFKNTVKPPLDILHFHKYIQSCNVTEKRLSSAKKTGSNYLPFDFILATQRLCHALYISLENILLKLFFRTIVRML